MTIEIDGAKGEGGGQIARTAISLSCALGKDVRIFNIRKGRKQPGLKAQHLSGIKLAGEMCDSVVEGLEIGSSEISFKPGHAIGGEYEVDVGTAGSVSLILQTCLLPAIFSRGATKLKITGGTDVPWSPSIDYMRMVLLPLLRRMGAEIEISITGRGFYPNGGGEIVAEISPAGGLRGLDLSKRGGLRGIMGFIPCVNLPEHVASRIRDSVIKAMSGGIALDIETGCSKGRSTGTSVTLCAEYENTVLGASALGEKGVPAEKIGEMAAMGLKEEMSSGSTLDEFATDQMLPFMAMARGESCFLTPEITSHAETNIAVIAELLDRVVDIKEQGAQKRVSVY